MRGYKLLFYCFSFGIMACQSNVERSAVVTIDTSRIVTDKAAEEETAAPIAFPQNVDLLLLTQYRKEATGYPKGVSEKDWIAFYQDEASKKWQLSHVKPKITFGRDECVGEDVMIIRSPKKNTICFFTAFPGLAEQPVTALADRLLFPGREVKFIFNDQPYKLSAMGSVMVFDQNQQYILPEAELKNKSDEAISDATIEHYQLFFTAPGVYYAIAAVPEINGAPPRLIWAGDLNNDGLPDLLISTPGFYENQQLSFFLSDIHDKEQPLKKVAELEVVNDC